MIDREKDASRVCFLIHERILQVEHPAQENIAWLTQRNRAGENRSRLDIKWMALG
jgi:hypothetical protein